MTQCEPQALARFAIQLEYPRVNERGIDMDRIRIAYLVCLIILAVGLGAELWPALQGRPVDAAGLMRLVVLVSVAGLLVALTGRRKA